MPRPNQVDDAVLHRSLEQALGPDRIRTDEETRHAFATDASPCVVEPRAVVSVASEADVIAVVRIARTLEIPITPRASGTSLSGAAIGPGIVLDTTRFRQILEFNEADRWVRVEPGVALSELNAYLGERGFRFAPDPGSQDVCRIGGMVGHNASGYRSVKYGQTRDHVIALRVVLANGAPVQARDLPIHDSAWADLVRRVPAFDAVRREIETHRDRIRASRRPVRKHSCGYPLLSILESLDRGIFPLASLFVGSEGTLGIVTEATLGVLPVPSRHVTALVYLDRFADLGPLVEEILRLGPSAMEAVDGDTLRLLDRASLDVPAGAEAMLLVEFDEGDLDGTVRALAERIAPRYALSRAVEISSNPDRQAVLWKVRRSVFPAIIGRPGLRKAWGFVEDPIVPRDRVPEFIAFLVQLARRHGTSAGIYGHIGDGNTHYRPFFDPTDPEDFNRMQSLRAEFDEALLDRFRGAPSGEHGIGRIRADILPRVWGTEVYGAMQRIKEALDPDGLMNPGVLFSSEPWWSAWGGLESRTPM